jgi:hypothetical protein
MNNQKDNKKKDNNLTTPLLNGGFVYTCFLNYIRDVVTVRSSSLSPRAIYTLEEICSDYFWELFDDGERRTAGRCMRHLVAKAEVPFIEVNEYRCQSPKRYRLN